MTDVHKPGITCEACRGTGRAISHDPASDNCVECGGLGHVHVRPPEIVCSTCGHVRHEVYVSINRATELTGLSRRTIYNWLKRGLLRTQTLASGRTLIARDSLFPVDGRRTRAGGWRRR